MAELGRVESLLGTLNAADAHFAQAQHLSETDTGKDGERTRRIMLGRGENLALGSRLQEAAALTGQAWQMLKALPDSPDRRSQAAGAASYAAHVLLRWGRPAEAADIAREGLLSADPDHINPRWLAGLHALRGLALLQIGRDAEAARALANANDLVVRKRLSVARNPWQWIAHGEALQLARSGRGSEALARWLQYRRAAGLPERPAADEASAAAIGAQFRLAAGEPDAALQDVERTLNALASDPHRADKTALDWPLHARRGQALLALGRVAEARQALAQAVQMGERVMATDASPELAETRRLLARALQAIGDRPGAEQQARAAQQVLARYPALARRAKEPGAGIPRTG